MMTLAWASGRSRRRLLSFGTIWCTVCFLAFRFSSNNHPPGTNNNGQGISLEALGQAGQARALLGNPDYQTVSGAASTSTRSASLSPTATGPSFLDQPQYESESPSSFTDPKVDSSKPLSEMDTYLNLANMSNLPLVYWTKLRKRTKVKAKNQKGKCKAEFPSLFELEFNNVFWQKLSSGGANYYLYNAYFDDRWRGGPLASVRILAMIDRIKPPKLICQLWYDSLSSPVIGEVSYIYGWYPKWGNYRDRALQPFIITCKCPRIKGLPKNRAPDSVSLVGEKCEKAENNLRVINDRPPVKQDFAVCVKGLDFLHEDLSVRLIEWLELLELLGAKKVFLYELETHPNMSKVLKYYQKRGLVQLTPITLAGHQPNLPGFRHFYLKNKLTNKRQNELIPYNDCLYRNLYSYQYVVLLDIDEVIMPLEDQNWSELMAKVQEVSLKLKNYTRASYNVRNVYFLDDVGEENMSHTGHEPGIPPYLHMLQHIYRSRNYTKPGQYVKCFHNTERVVSLHNHFPLNCFGGCTTYSIDTSLAHLQHYRKDCVGPLKNSCKTDFRMYTVRDPTIWRYKGDLIKKSDAVLKELGFI